MKKILPFVFIPMFFVACNKRAQDNAINQPQDSTTDQPIEQPKIQSCKLSKVVYNDYFTLLPKDSVEFIYKDDLIVRTNELATGRYYTFEYINGKLVKRNHFLSGATTAAAYTNFTYNAENNITGIDIYDNNLKVRSYELIYNAGKLNKALLKRYTQGVEYIFSENTYTYTGENISRAVMVSDPSIQPDTAIIQYTYDLNENYYKKQANQFLVEPFFFNQEGSIYPYIFSKNNVANVVYNGNQGTQSTPQTYQVNSSGYITALITNNRVGVSYFYECK